MIGTNFGRIRWLGKSKKTVEGSVGMFLSMMLCIGKFKRVSWVSLFSYFATHQVASFGQNIVISEPNQLYF